MSILSLFLTLYNSLPKKGVKCGLDAYNLLKKKYPKVELTLFGLEKNPNISGEINYIYAPSRHQLSELYSESVVFLFPSLEEGWGLTPLEAMTAGCVVVGTNTGCMIDLGKNKENVLISEPGDVQGMVNNLTYVIENPEEAKTISFNGYNTVQQLNWENSSNEFEKQLLKIVGGNDEN